MGIHRYNSIAYLFVTNGRRCGEARDPWGRRVADLDADRVVKVVVLLVEELLQMTEEGAWISATSTIWKQPGSVDTAAELRCADCMAVQLN